VLVAELINEMKKRKDLVEKYTLGKEKVNVIHGINKKINRGAQLLKNVTVINQGFDDKEFNDLMITFHHVQSKIPLVYTMIQEYQRMEREYLQKTNLISLLFPCNEHKYHEIITKMIDENFNELDVNMKNITKQLESIQNTFKGPLLIIRKRQGKELDHLRLINLNSNEQDSIPSQDFFDLNAELCKELPVFITHVKNAIGIIIQEFVNIQYNYYQKNITLFQKLQITSEPIIEKYKKDFRNIEILGRNIKLAHKWHRLVWE
jgi:hypothetical protein